MTPKTSRTERMFRERLIYEMDKNSELYALKNGRIYRRSEGVSRLTLAASVDEMNMLNRQVKELERENAALKGANLPPIEGDCLPPIGSTVEIHLARSDEWVKHEVIGYYVWPDLGGDKYLHRVFVRVCDSAGYENARLLSDIRITN